MISKQEFLQAIKQGKAEKEANIRKFAVKVNRQIEALQYKKIMLDIETEIKLIGIILGRVCDKYTPFLYTVDKNTKETVVEKVIKKWQAKGWNVAKEEYTNFISIYL